MRPAGRGPIAVAAALLAVACAAAVAWWLLRRPPPLLEPAYLWPVTVSTVAGGQTRGAADGPPVAARFSDPFGIAIDPDGVTYVADAGDNNSIRRIGQAGIVSVLAGGGGAGFADGAPAAARFRTPSGLAYDPIRRRLIVADTGNHAIRAVTTRGEVTTLAGNGTPGVEDGEAAAARFDGPLGVAVRQDGTIVVADTYNDRIRLIGSNGEVSTLAGGRATGCLDGPSSEALFDTPSGVAVCPDGNVFVADTGNNRIRRIDAVGNVTTVTGVAPDGAGGGWGGVYHPVAVACDEDGRLYVTEANRVVLFARGLGAVTLAGAEAGFADGAGPLARFRGPSGIALDNAGVVRVADAENQRVRQLTPPDLAPPARDVDITPVSWLARPGGAAVEPRLKWPVDPQDGSHEVTATAGEARGSAGGDGRERLHTGVDVRAQIGAIVRAVLDDEARRPLAATSYESLNESIRLGNAAYVHVRVGRRGKESLLDPARFSIARGPTGEPVRVRVRRGTRFETGDLVGTVNRYAHVHLDVGPPGGEMNPLTLGLPNLSDRVAPTIPRGGVAIFDADGSRFTAKKKGRLLISGCVSIVVEAYDRVDGNAPRRRLAPYSLRWQVLESSGRPAPGFASPRVAIEFDRLPQGPEAPLRTYADGSGITVYGSPVTRFRFIVTNTVRDGEAEEGMWDTSALPPGDYVLRVFADDLAGNTATSDTAITIQSAPSRS